MCVVTNLSLFRSRLRCNGSTFADCQFAHQIERLITGNEGLTAVAAGRRTKSQMDRVSCSRGGLPSCTGRPCCAPSQPFHRRRQVGRRRASHTRCDAAWSEVVASGLYSVSSSIQNASNVLATVSPSFLQPTVNILGSDLASTIALHPSWQGLSRLAVGLQLVPMSNSIPCQITRFSMWLLHATKSRHQDGHIQHNPDCPSLLCCRAFGTSLAPVLALSLASQTSMSSIQSAETLQRNGECLIWGSETG